MVPIEYRTYIPRGYGLIGFIIIGFLYKELAARARENHATTEYLQARYIAKHQPCGQTSAIWPNNSYVAMWLNSSYVISDIAMQPNISYVAKQQRYSYVAKHQPCKYQRYSDVAIQQLCNLFAQQPYSLFTIEPISYIAISLPSSISLMFSHIAIQLLFGYMADVWLYS